MSGKSTTNAAPRKKTATNKTAKRKVKKSAQVARNAAATRVTAKPKRLAGGNPQIAKGDGDGAVQTYIAAMPGWKRDVGRRLDALIQCTVPGVHKVVRWTSPFYGVEGQGWFLSYHCFTKYVKVAFFRGTSLHPQPPVESRDPDTRYVHIREDNQPDEERLAQWIRQAAALPGWDLGTKLRPLSSTTLVTTQQPITGRKPPVPGRDSSVTPNEGAKMIDERIRDLGDWRGAVLKRMRTLIHEADPKVVEEWKWRKKTSPGTPVWSHDGGICTGESYKQVVKLTFFHGASLKDPAHLFNSSLEGSTRRAIDIRQDDVIDEAAFKKLIRAAVAFNMAKRKK